MFIERDLRKIPEILVDPKDPRTALKLSRRGPELSGSLRLLMESAGPRPESVRRVEYLSLYDDQLRSVEGIGLFGESPLRTLNLGKNLLSALPDEMARLTSLESLLLEDCEFSSFPLVVCGLSRLRLLTLSNNPIASLPAGVGELLELRELVLDHCGLSSLPAELSGLPLVRLSLGNNRLQSLPEVVFSLSLLQDLSVNSNVLESLPSGLGRCRSLRTLIANANKIISVDASLQECGMLVKVNLCHNLLENLPGELLAYWKEGPNAPAVSLEGNPMCANPHSLHPSAFTQPVTDQWRTAAT